MKKYNTMFVFDGATNGIAKIKRRKSKEGKEFFNVYMTVGFEKADFCDNNLYVSLTEEDMLTLINNIKSKRVTLIGVTDSFDEIID